MFRILALAAVLAVASAQRISVSETSLSIREGTKHTIIFKLDAPIVCSDGTDTCDVTFGLTNSHPNDIELDTCHVRWFADEATEERRVTISARENFIDDRERTFTIRTEPVKQPLSEYYNNFNPADIVLKTRGRGSGSCSGTGDPHYKSFDGLAFHIFKGGQTVFFKSGARAFEMQARMFNARDSGGRERPAVHCGIAGLEDNQRVIVDVCNGRRAPKPQLTFTGPARLHPKVIVSGNSYRVEYKSGTIMTANVNFWSTIQRYYLNVYLTVPGIDRNSGGSGICGNFDGNAANDTPKNWFYKPVSQLAPEQYIKVGSPQDLWIWTPPSPLPVPSLPPNAAECAIPPVNPIKPLLEVFDAEDITDLLKAAEKNVKPADRVYTFSDDEVLVLPPSKPLANFTLAQAMAACDAFIAKSKIATVCKAVLEGTGKFLLSHFTQDCYEDLMATGDTQWQLDTIITLEEDCAELALKDQNTWETDANGNPIEPNTAIRENMCPEDCNGNGKCVSGRCQCDPGFVGGTCAGDTTAAPMITNVVDAFCNVRLLSTCRSVEVVAVNLIPSSQAKCRFGGQTEVKATYLGDSVTCVPPAMPSHAGAQEASVSLEITNDGSRYSNAVQYTYFDGNCQACNATAGCGPNPTSCQVGGQCFTEQTSMPTANGINACRKCLPALSTSAFSFTYTNGLGCGPQFAQAAGYDFHVAQGGAKRGTTLVEVSAQNPNTAADPNNVVTYAFAPQTGANPTPFPFEIVASPTARNGAIIRLTQDVAVEPKSSVAIIVATDQAGHVAETTFTFNQDTDSFFLQDTVDLTVAENTPVGTPIFTIQVKPEFQGIAFSYFNTPANPPFAVDPVTGVISVARNIDHEAEPVFIDTIKADLQQQSGIFHLKVTILNVNEAPTGVALSSATVEEQVAVGTAVGTLVTADPDAENMFTYRILAGAADFAIRGDELTTARVFTFDTAVPANNAFTVTVEASDGEFTVSNQLTVTLVNVNQKPVDVQLVAFQGANVNVQGTAIDISEARQPGRLSGIAVTDPDGDTVFKCFLVNDANGAFGIVADTDLYLLKRLDFEGTAASNHQVEFSIRCADPAGLVSDLEVFQVTIANADDAPTVTDFQLDQPAVSEATAVNTEIGTVTAVDDDPNSVPFTLAVTENAATFAIVNVVCAQDPATLAQVCTGRVAVVGPLDFEASPEAPTFTVTAQTPNTPLASSTVLAVPVADANDAPARPSVTVLGLYPDSAPGETVATLLVTDQDASDALSVALTQGASRFVLVPAPARRRRRAAQAEFDLNVAPGGVGQLTLGETVAFALTVSDAGGAATNFASSLTVTKRPLELELRTGCGSGAPAAAAPSFTELATAPVGCLFVKGAADQAAVQYSVAGPFSVAARELVPAARLFGAATVDAVVTASAEGETVTATFTVAVVQILESPTFAQASPLALRIDDDATGVVQNFALANPDALPFALSFGPVSNGFDPTTLFELLATTTAAAPEFNLVLKDSPAKAQIPDGDYTFVIDAVAPDAGNPNAQLTVALTIFNQCASAPCAAGEQCLDQGASHVCCAQGTADQACIAEFPGIGALQNSGADSEAGLGVPAIVGIVIAALIVAALVVLAVVLTRGKEQPTFNDLESATWEHQENPTFVKPGAVDDFEPGLSNPIYGWYHPDMSRQECTNYLLQQGEGSFAVRDSKATPGWHMLAVKTRNTVVHDKIKMEDDGTYALLPSTGATSTKSQPKFKSIPELVDHYAQHNADLGYHLALDNPMYDNHQMLQERDGTARRGELIGRDAAAPLVPLKEREHGAVGTVAEYADGEDLYTNTEQAKVAISEA